MKQERDIINEILLRASERGHRLFRNNSGVAKYPDGSSVKYGVGGTGGSDLIGWSRDGKFVALEVKTPGTRTSKEQRAFVDAAHRAGCIAEVVFSADEALALLP